MTARAFEMLGEVASDTDTRWSLVFDTGEKTFHFRTFRNFRTRRIDLKTIDFDYEKKARMLDPHADLGGDVAAAFSSYSHDNVFRHMLKALNYFRPGVSEEFIRQAVGLFESYGFAARGRARGRV